MNDSGKGLLVRAYQGAISTKWAHKKSFSQVVKDLKSMGTEWKQVYRKKKVYPSESKDECTIFISNIPSEASARDIWEFFKMGGTIKDIILPKRRDRRNHRYGFVKTTSELEAGKIISNLKQFKGLGRILKMSINKMEKAKVSGKISISPMVKSTKVRTNVGETLVYQLDKNGGSKRRDDKLRDDVLIENMFSFVEAEINTELEESLLGSYICYSDKMNNAVQLKEMLLSDGLVDARIL